VIAAPLVNFCVAGDATEPTARFDRLGSILDIVAFALEPLGCLVKNDHMRATSIARRLGRPDWPGRFNPPEPHAGPVHVTDDIVLGVVIRSTARRRIGGAIAYTGNIEPGTIGTTKNLCR
jgi:hypothetical protein